MNSAKKSTITALAISALFLVASTSVFAEGYTQKQNEINDEQGRKTERMSPQGSGQQSQQGQQGSGSMSGQSGQGSQGSSSGTDSSYGSGSTGSSGSSGGSNSSSGGGY